VPGPSDTAGPALRVNVTNEACSGSAVGGAPVPICRRSRVPRASRPLAITVNPRSVTSRARLASAGPGAVASTTSVGHRRNRSCLMSVGRTPGGIARLHDSVTVMGVSSGFTWATTNSGPIANSGCGREARKTWAWPAAGRAASSRAARRSAQARGTLHL
jgi:hypothetical protein